uniref:Uncharacterized protein n=1 Tax=Branchiostoma floridae TaxID=7739 RepID=C3ZUL6_BRAFL|eukprot:XP_002587717.1 hypothetical protein BRAFLDRAFT_94621 [Branchiostoma floridae]
MESCHSCGNLFIKGTKVYSRKMISTIISPLTYKHVFAASPSVSCFLCSSCIQQLNSKTVKWKRKWSARLSPSKSPKGSVRKSFGTQSSSGLMGSCGQVGDAVRMLGRKQYLKAFRLLLQHPATKQQLLTACKEAIIHEHVDLPDVHDFDGVMDLMMALDGVEVEEEVQHVDLPDVPDLDDVMDLMMALDDIEVEVGGKTEDGDTVPWFGKVADAVTKRSQIKVQWYVITPDHSYKTYKSVSRPRHILKCRRYWSMKTCDGDPDLLWSRLDNIVKHYQYHQILRNAREYKVVALLSKRCWALVLQVFQLCQSNSIATKDRQATVLMFRPFNGLLEKDIFLWLSKYAIVPQGAGMNVKTLVESLSCDSVEQEEPHPSHGPDDEDVQQGKVTCRMLQAVAADQSQPVRRVYDALERGRAALVPPIPYDVGDVGGDLE